MNPIVMALAVAATLGLEVMMYGADEFTPGRFPDLARATPDIDDSPCSESGFADAVMCVAIVIAQWFANIFGFIVWLFSAIGFVALWIMDLASFGVTGAPWYARVILATGVTGSLGWSLAKYIRGT